MDKMNLLKRFIKDEESFLNRYNKQIDVNAEIGAENTKATVHSAQILRIQEAISALEGKAVEAVSNHNLAEAEKIYGLKVYQLEKLLELIKNYRRAKLRYLFLLSKKIEVKNKTLGDSGESSAELKKVMGARDEIVRRTDALIQGITNSIQRDRDKVKQLSKQDIGEDRFTTLLNKIKQCYMGNDYVEMATILREMELMKKSPEQNKVFIDWYGYYRRQTGK